MLGSSPLIGLEVGAQTLKAVRAVRAGGRLAWQYRQHTRHEGTDARALWEDLAALLRPWRRERFRARLFVAAPHSYVRRLVVRASSTSTIDEAVRAQLPSLLPFDVERAYVHLAVETQRPSGHEVEATVLISACERAAAKELLDAVLAAGWPVMALVPSGVALYAALAALEVASHEPAVVLELGAQHSTIALVETARLLYARDIALGDEHLTDALTRPVHVEGRTVALTAEQARALKARIGIPESSSEVVDAELPMPLATYLSLVQPILEQVVAEVRRTMALTSSGSAESAPQRLLLTGDGSRLPNVPHWLSGQLGVPVTRLHCEQFVGAAGANATMACGLVLGQRVRTSVADLQPPSIHRQAIIARTANRVWKVLAVMLVLLWLCTGQVHVKHQEVERHVADLAAQWQLMQPVMDVEQSIEEHQRVLQRLTDGTVPAEWFHQLAEDFPEPVRLSRLSVASDGSVRLAGQAQGREQTPEATLSALTLWLEERRVCQGTQLESSQRVGAAEQTVEFSVSCHRP